jgi:hypothetical protein
VSGNPGGRPRGMTVERVMALALKEAYRPLQVREGDKVFTLPAVQAVMRCQTAQAVKGNGPAQRAFIERALVIEQELAAQAAATANARPEEPTMSSMELARRIAHIFALSAR